MPSFSMAKAGRSPFFSFVLTLYDDSRIRSGLSAVQRGLMQRAITHCDLGTGPFPLPFMKNSNKGAKGL